MECKKTALCLILTSLFLSSPLVLADTNSTQMAMKTNTASASTNKTSEVEQPPSSFKVWLSGSVLTSFTRAYRKQVAQGFGPALALGNLMQSMATQPMAQLGSILSKKQKTLLQMKFIALALEAMTLPNSKLTENSRLAQTIIKLNYFTAKTIHLVKPPTNYIAGFNDIYFQKATPFVALLGQTEGSKFAKLYYSTNSKTSGLTQSALTSYGTALVNLYHIPGMTKELLAKIKNDLNTFNQLVLSNPKILSQNNFFNIATMTADIGNGLLIYSKNPTKLITHVQNSLKQNIAFITRQNAIISHHTKTQNLKMPPQAMMRSSNAPSQMPDETQQF